MEVIALMDGLWVFLSFTILIQFPGVNGGNNPHLKGASGTPGSSRICGYYPNSLSGLLLPHNSTYKYADTQCLTNFFFFPRMLIAGGTFSRPLLQRLTCNVVMALYN